MLSNFTSRFGRIRSFNGCLWATGDSALVFWGGNELSLDTENIVSKYFYLRGKQHNPKYINHYLLCKSPNIFAKTPHDKRHTLSRAGAIQIPDVKKNTDLTEKTKFLQKSIERGASSYLRDPNKFIEFIRNRTHLVNCYW